MKRMTTAAMSALFSIFLLGFQYSPAWAQSENEPVPMAAVPAAEVSPSEEIAPTRANFSNRASTEAYIDGVIQSLMAADNIAGVSLAIVKDGEVFLAKGYCFSNLEARTPVDSSSMFRIGSISKTFVWTALMQLVEEGQITLDDPVNDHLPVNFQIPDGGYDEPIRIWHLMSHSPGFEDGGIGYLFSNSADLTMTLDDYLLNYRPDRVRPAGVTTSYSNYGAALAGKIVAHVSAMGFEDYMDARIFAPLGMSSSSFREPLGDDARDGHPTSLSDELAARISSGFEWKKGWFEEGDFEWITSVAPAGSVSSSADDMALFMLAHLGFGANENGRMLSEESQATMRELTFSNAESINGLAHGFIQYTMPGEYDAWGHGGDTIYFHSNMIMVPELDLGIYVSTNSIGGGGIRNGLPNLIVEHFFTDGALAKLTPPEDFAERGQRFAGTYEINRRSYSKLERIFGIPGSFMTVSVDEEGYLLLTAGPNTSRWVETAPLTFRNVKNGSVIAFREDEDGTITQFLIAFGIMAGDRVGFFSGPNWFFMIVGLAVLGSIGAITGSILRRKREITQTVYEKYGSRIIAANALTWILFFVLFGLGLAPLAGGPTAPFDPFPSTLLFLSLWAALIGALLSLAGMASLYPVWQAKSWPLWRRIRHSVVVVVFFTFALTLNYWNLIGFKYF